jgi:hypothetical protein
MAAIASVSEQNIKQSFLLLILIISLTNLTNFNLKSTELTGRKLSDKSNL